MDSASGGLNGATANINVVDVRQKQSRRAVQSQSATAAVCCYQINHVVIALLTTM